jgi:hypothetical protein
MTDIITQICAALVQIGAGVTGITKTFDPPKAGMPSTAELPALWVFTGGTSDDYASLGNNMVYVPRQFRVQVAVTPTGQGDPNTRESLCRPLLMAVRAAFAHHSGLSVNWVQDMRLLGDSGIVVLPEYGGAFIGFELRLTVGTIEKRVLVD